MEDKTVKVVIYARVSTQEQAAEGTSLDSQVEQMESYCKTQGWTLTDKYIDPGYTGKDASRPGLKRLLDDAKLGLFNKVIVFRMDRLARNLRLLLEIEDKLKRYGVSFHSVKETFDTSTASGRHFLQMLGMISEWERETIIERTKAGRLQRYREGC
jgi:site-specific DNA recombinase